MRERKTNNLGQPATNEQERAQTTAKRGRKGYSKKSSKASSRRRKGRASAGRKQRGGQRQAVYSIAELLPAKIIRKLKEMKQVGKS